MAWTNAFDIGACEVAVANASSELFRQSMGKGDSATFGDEDEYAVDIDDAGIASLNGPQIGGSGGSFALRVIPASIPSGSACRVRGMTIDVSSFGTSSAAAIWDQENGVQTDLDASGDGWTPDPCVKDSDAVELSVYGLGLGV